MTEVCEDYDEYLKNLYKQFCDSIIEQMEKQGFSKVQIAVQKMMYEKREDLFEEFCDRYDLEYDSDDDVDDDTEEIIFTPE